jgi:tripartite-type tricarboxylate transporter receptor subunit TctC
VKVFKRSPYPAGAGSPASGLAPAGTPKPVVDKLNKAINQIITSEAMKSFFVKEGASPVAMSSEAFANHLATELERWKTIAQNANIQAD